jgi:hypothetical protein
MILGYHCTTLLPETARSVASTSNGPAKRASVVVQHTEQEDFRKMPISYFQTVVVSSCRKSLCQEGTIRLVTMQLAVRTEFGHTHRRCQSTQAHLTSSLRRRVVVPNPQPIQSRSPDRVPQSFLQDSPRTQQKANERRKGKHTRNPRRVSSLASASVALLFLPGWWRALTRKWISGYLRHVRFDRQQGSWRRKSIRIRRATVLLLSIIAYFQDPGPAPSLLFSRTGQMIESHRRFAFGPFLYTVRDC